MSKLEELTSEFVDSVNTYLKGEHDNPLLMEKIIKGWSNYLGCSRDELICLEATSRPNLNKESSVKELLKFKNDGFWHILVGFKLILSKEDILECTIFNEFSIRQDGDEYIVKYGNPGKSMSVYTIDETELYPFYKSVYNKSVKAVKQHVNNVEGDVFDSKNQTIFIQ